MAESTDIFKMGAHGSPKNSSDFSLFAILRPIGTEAASIEANWISSGGKAMRMDERADLYGRRNHRAGFEQLASAALAYLRSRSSEHWLMFLAGLMIGLFLG
jgi:hypothetical protein